MTMERRHKTGQKRVDKNTRTKRRHEPQQQREERKDNNRKKTGKMTTERRPWKTKHKDSQV